jgi:TolB protein
MRKAPGPQFLKVAVVFWTRTTIIRAITGRTIAVLAVALLVVGSTASPSFSEHVEKKQGQKRASQPRVSPDGQRIAFVLRTTDGNSGLYIVGADGTNLRRLSNGDDDMPAWSSDSKKVAFRRWGKAETQSLVVINADGTGERVINTGQKSNQCPSFSPDGKQFVLSLDGEIGFGIFIINADGSNPRKVSAGGWPAWSPDGKQIAFNGNADPASPNRIFVVNADGTQKRQVSTGDGAHECAAWSADGKRIAYQASLRDKATGKSNALVRVVNVDGSGDVAVGTHSRPYLDEMPSWFPDGKHLTIQSDRDGAMAIYIIDLNGKTLARVTP